MTLEEEGFFGESNFFEDLIFFAAGVGFRPALWVCGEPLALFNLVAEPKGFCSTAEGCLNASSWGPLTLRLLVILCAASLTVL